MKEAPLSSSINYTGTQEKEEEYENYSDDLASFPGMLAIFYSLYLIIFVIGMSGNSLVCYVVYRNKNMHTVTNLFITNLAVSDILLCLFSLPLTPLYLLVFKNWIFGKLFCHLFPWVQGISVYTSAFTLMFIAIDRYFVIIYPFKARMKLGICLFIVFIVWMSASILTLPYGYFMEIQINQDKQTMKTIYYCNEVWFNEQVHSAFGLITSTLQFGIPFMIILFCYVKICRKLSKRANSMLGAKSARKEEMEKERTKKTNRMLIGMVAIFGLSWLPLNSYNLLLDFNSSVGDWRFSRIAFLFTHSIAMSSTCYNVFLYAWLNDNFRKEFKDVLPCFHSVNSNFKRRYTGESVAEKAINNCSGQSGQTTQESFVFSEYKMVNV